MITLEKLVYMMSVAPNRRFGIEPQGFNVYELDEEYKIDPEGFMTMGRSTPFDGWSVFGKCLMTVCGGKIAWIDDSFKTNMNIN